MFEFSDENMEHIVGLIIKNKDHEAVMNKQGIFLVFNFKLGDEEALLCRYITFVLFWASTNGILVGCDKNLIGHQ